MKTDQTAANQGVLPLNLSQELDDHGIPFVRAKDGTTVFGEITQEQSSVMGTGVSAPLKLSFGNWGYGLRHIERNRGLDLRAYSYTSVEDFVEQVSKGYDKIQKGNLREIVPGSWVRTFMLVKKNARIGKNGRSKDGVLYIELSINGSYYNVNSGGVFKQGYTANKESGELWNANP
jgi:hypothetical protein